MMLPSESGDMTGTGSVRRKEWNVSLKGIYAPA